MTAKLQRIPIEVVFWLDWGTLWLAAAAVAFSPLWMNDDDLCLVAARCSALCLTGSAIARLANRTVQVTSSRTHLTIGSIQIPANRLRDVELVEVRRGYRVRVRLTQTLLPIVLDVEGVTEQRLDWLCVFRCARIRHFGRWSIIVLMLGASVAFPLLVYAHSLVRPANPLWTLFIACAALVLCSGLFGAHDAAIVSFGAEPRKLQFERAGLFYTMTVNRSDAEAVSLILGFDRWTARRAQREVAVLVTSLPQG